MARDLDDVLAELERQGFHARRTRRGHWLVRNKDGQRVITTLSGSASDPRALRNGLAQLKRAGFRWPPR